MPPEIDQLPGRGDPGDERVDESGVVVGVGREERVHRPVVVGVGVRVEQSGPSGRVGRADRSDHGRVSAFGDVRDGLEREHRRTVEP